MFKFKKLFIIYITVFFCFSFIANSSDDTMIKKEIKVRMNSFNKKYKAFENKGDIQDLYVLIQNYKDFCKYANNINDLTQRKNLTERSFEMGFKIIQAYAKHIDLKYSVNDIPKFTNLPISNADCRKIKDKNLKSKLVKERKTQKKIEDYRKLQDQLRMANIEVKNQLLKSLLQYVAISKDNKISTKIVQNLLELK